MNQNLKDKLILIGIITFGVLIVFGCYYYLLESYDQDCLNKYSEAYCNSLNMTLDKNNPTFYDFRCFTQKNRTGTKYENFYYLDSEKQECCKKESESFKLGCSKEVKE